MIGLMFLAQLAAAGDATANLRPPTVGVRLAGDLVNRYMRHTTRVGTMDFTIEV